MIRHDLTGAKVLFRQNKTGWTCSTKPSRYCLVTNWVWRRSKSPGTCSISGRVRASGPSTSVRLTPFCHCPKVLTNDIGTAREHPQSHVIGTDLSKIQPENVLPNVEFIREDCEDQWVFPHKFDYIHGRMLFSCFDNPRGVLEQAFQFLNPGGWIEYIDAVRLPTCAPKPRGGNLLTPHTGQESAVASMDGTAEGK